MRIILLISMLALPLLSLAQDKQVVCMQKFDERFKSAGTEMINMAGALNYTALVERITQCIQAGKCIKVEAYISMAEVMVDEEIIKVQREKVGLLKSYFAKNRDQFRSNDYCYILESFSPILEKMQSLNRTQFNRYGALIQKLLNTIPKI